MHSQVKKIEELIRMGLMPIKDISILKQAIKNIDAGNFLPSQQRTVFNKFLNKYIQITLNDPSIERKMKTNASKMKFESFFNEAMDLKKIPDGMLEVIANGVKRKLRAGGKATESDRLLSTKARIEMRRRRNEKMNLNKNESVSVPSYSYNECVKIAMEHFKVSSLNELDINNSKEFFSYIDTIHKNGE